MIDVNSLNVTAKLIPRLKQVVNVPILLFAYETDEPSIFLAYQMGISDYVIKPISPQVFQAKVQSWLNYTPLTGVEDTESIQVGEFELTLKSRELLIQNGTSIKLTHLEFRLLHLLMTHSGQTLSIGTITSRVWGYIDQDATSLKNLIYRIRRKIEPDSSQPRYIQYISGEGYMFQP